MKRPRAVIAEDESILGTEFAELVAKRWRELESRRKVTIAVGVLCMPVASVVGAQQEADGVVSLGKVEVTGSNIKRVEGETGLPLQIMTREELLRGGVQTAQELLQRISANQSFGSFNEAMGEGSTLVGFTSASLRGLGSQRTLVLLNGRRLAPYALSGGQSVDLSAIPASAIDRVEILKDGASAVYGTDAIGGVINFILRDDFTGAEFNGNYYATEQGGGNNWRVNATAGKGSLAKDRYNVFVSVDYFKQDSLGASQRDSTKTALIPEIGFDRTSPYSFPANINQAAHSNVFFNPTIPLTGATADSCFPPVSFPTPKAPFACRFDYASVIDTIPEAEKTNVFARFTGRIDTDTQFFAEGAYYHGSFTQRMSPTAVISNAGRVVLPPVSPFYPTGFVAGMPGGDPTRPVVLDYRTIELGPRIDRARAEQWNAVVGLEGVLEGWDYALAAIYTSNRQIDEYLRGFVSDHLFTPLVLSGVVDPFGPNAPATLDRMRATQITGEANDNRASNYGVSASMSNDVYKLAAGPVAVALGLDARRERLEQGNADFLVDGDVLGGAGVIPSLPVGTRTVWSLFGEASVPIAPGLEASLAARYDHYSDFGGTTNPKVTLRWQPSRTLLLRGSYGTGFRAPTLSDLFQPQLVNYSEGDFGDPIRCPVTSDSFDCDGVAVKTGGNPALQPERSRQLNAGIVFEPASGLSASVDYYRVTIRNVIATVGLDAIFNDYAQWAPSYVVRKPPDAEHPNLPGPIEYVVQTQTNVGQITTSGLDLNLRWQGGATPRGQVSVDLDGTYVLDYRHTGFASLADASGVGMRPDDGTGVIARYRQYAQLNWAWSAWGATLANTYQSGYRECDLLTVDPGTQRCTGTRHVASYAIWDLQGRYTGFRNATLTVGVHNLFDRDPPLSSASATSPTFQAGIDPSYADPRGRIYYAALRYAFQ